MHRLFFAVLVFFIPVFAIAFYPVEVTQERSSDWTIIEDVGLSRVYYGELVGEPHTFEFLIKKDTEISLEVLIPNVKQVENNITVIMIKEVDRGVEEVVRLKAGETDWSHIEKKDGNDFRVGQNFSKDLESGVYRIEMSTPDNLGKYALELHGRSEDERSYVERVGETYRMKKFFDKGVFATVFSPIVLKPLSFVVLIFAGMFFARRWYQNRSVKVL